MCISNVEKSSNLKIALWSLEMHQFQGHFMLSLPIALSLSLSLSLYLTFSRTKLQKQLFFLRERRGKRGESRAVHYFDFDIFYRKMIQNYSNISPQFLFTLRLYLLNRTAACLITKFAARHV